MRVVLDANVYLSGIPRLRDQDTPPRKLIGAWISGAYDLLISDHIIAEVVRNLRKPYFASILEGTDADLVFQEIRSYAEVVAVPPRPSLPREATHPEDNYVLATALEGQADYLVTGDRQLQKITFIGNTFIVSPAEMLRIVEERPTS